MFKLEGAAAQQFVRDLQSGAVNLENEPVVGRCEVASILSNYISRLHNEFTQFATAPITGYPLGLDFKGGDEVYEVEGKLLRSDEFGNFAAGYAASRAFGVPGYLMMVSGGVVYATVGDEGSFDAPSRPMINAGARRGIRDRWESFRSWGRQSDDQASAPLTSRAGCP